MANAHVDDNRKATLLAASNAGTGVPVELWADPTTHRLLVTATLTGGSSIPVSGATTATVVAIVDGSGNQITSFGGGTQYTEGDTDTTITGTAMMWEDASDTLRAVSAAKPLPVDIQDATVAVTQSGTWNITNISGTVSLPTGAATAAKQPALGTAGSASTDVITIQGIASMTAVKVDGSAVTQPISAASLPLPTGASTLAEQQSQTTHLATIAGDTTDIETAVELIDDTVATLGTTTYTEASTKGLIIGAVRRDADTTLVDTTNEVGPLQMNAAGQLKVEVFSGETLPVSGTLAVTQSGTWDEVGINDSGNSITVDNGGTFVVQENGAALTALQLIDDTVSTDDTSTHTPTTTKALNVAFVADETTPDSVDEGDIGMARMTLNRRLITASHTADDAAMETGTKPSIIGAIADESSTDSVDEGDAGYVRMDLARNLRVTEGSLRGPGIPVIDSYTQASFNLAAGADQVLVSSAPNKQIWVYGIGFTVNVAGTVSFQDEDNTAITGVMQMGATGGMTVAPSGNFSMPLWKLATDKDLEVDVVTSELDGWVSYAIVSV